MSDLTASKSYSIKADILKKYKLESVSSSKHKAEAYKYSELNALKYSALNLKKYNNLHYDKTSGFIKLDLTLNKIYKEVVVCNKSL